MGIQRNNPQRKGMERVLNEIEGRYLSDIELNIMVIRMLKAFSKNYKEL